MGTLLCLLRGCRIIIDIFKQIHGFHEDVSDLLLDFREPLVRNRHRDHDGLPRSVQKLLSLFPRQPGLNVYSRALGSLRLHLRCTFRDHRPTACFGAEITRFLPATSVLRHCVSRVRFLVCGECASITNTDFILIPRSHTFERFLLTLTLQVLQRTILPLRCFSQ